MTYLSMNIAIIGGGVAGLSLAMNLHRHGIAARVYERAPEFRELGVGITLLPHAMREFAALGVAAEIERAGVVIGESAFFNRFGQRIYREERGRHAGYPFPEVSIHRGRLHVILYRAALERLGAGAILTGHDCAGIEQDDGGVTVRFRSAGAGAAPVRADIVIACDGVNSVLRRQFYPGDGLAFAGINTWRGVTRRKPFLGGRTYTRTGSILTGKMVIYPIADGADDDGNQLINWMAEIQRDAGEKNDWNQPGRLADFLPIYQDWRFDWLDVAELISTADQILEYPMVDKDPVNRWTFGRVTLLGDAAHPMYPRGSNGAAQAAIDARTLADALARGGDPRDALKDYEARRLPAANKVVLTNRAHPPDFINIRVEELVGDRPFDDLDRYISQAELRALSENYKRIAGFALGDVETR
jgi:2-polyprenyl-6-methoxyphenol hydroxylase-like FAD-dependent oxidoreductase